MSQRCGSMAPSVRPKIKHARWLIAQGVLFRVCPYVLFHCPFTRQSSYNTTLRSILCFFLLSLFAILKGVCAKRKNGWIWQWYRYVTRKRERLCKANKMRNIRRSSWIGGEDWAWIASPADVVLALAARQSHHPQSGPPSHPHPHLPQYRQSHHHHPRPHCR